MRRNEEELKKISSGIGKVEVVTILIFRNIMKIIPMKRKVVPDVAGKNHFHERTKISTALTTQNDDETLIKTTNFVTEKIPPSKKNEYRFWFH